MIHVHRGWVLLHKLGVYLSFLGVYLSFLGVTLNAPFFFFLFQVLGWLDIFHSKIPID